jgi:Ca-activated chloride channel homolog
MSHARDKSGVARLAPYLFSAGVLGWIGAGPGQQLSVFRARGDLVRVFVTVTDRDGHLVTTLAQDDFEVRDEGKPQPITQFDNTPQPIHLIVMVDLSGSMQGTLRLLRGAAAQLLSHLRSDDDVRIGYFGFDIKISPVLRHDAREVAAALPKSMTPDAPTPLWRALYHAVEAFGALDDGRKVILVMSDGQDSYAASFPISLPQLIDYAREHDVMIYALAACGTSLRR